MSASQRPQSRPAGLRRFVAGGSAAPGAGPVAQAASPSAERVPTAGPGPVAERCGLCDAPVDQTHGHVVDRHEQRLVCTCRACYLLFTGDWNGGRYRAVPDRYLSDPRHPITAAAWEQLQVPVGIAFFIRGMAGREIAAFYPSPAGATECLLDLPAWNRLTEELPLLAAAVPEVEAILVRRTDEGFEGYLVPVDVCYELVGAMRMNWRGFDGGAEAKEHIGAFFERIADQARELAPAEG